MDTFGSFQPGAITNIKFLTIAALQFLFHSIASKTVSMIKFTTHVCLEIARDHTAILICLFSKNLTTALISQTGKTKYVSQTCLCTWDRLVKKLYFDNDIDKAAKCVNLADLLKPQTP